MCRRNSLWELAGVPGGRHWKSELSVSCHVSPSSDVRIFSRKTNRSHRGHRLSDFPMITEAQKDFQTSLKSPCMELNCHSKCQMLFRGTLVNDHLNSSGNV